MSANPLLKWRQQKLDSIATDLARGYIMDWPGKVFGVAITDKSKPFFRFDTEQPIEEIFVVWMDISVYPPQLVGMARGNDDYWQQDAEGYWGVVNRWLKNPTRLQVRNYWMERRVSVR